MLAILGTALFITLVDNGAFFRGVLAATAGAEHRAAILVTLFVLVAATLVLILSIAAGRHLLKLTAATLLCTAAAASYFMSNYGVVFDVTMIRNVAETDVREASPLVTAPFLLRFSAVGLLPTLLVLLLPLDRVGWRRSLGIRSGTLTGALLLLSALLYANFGPVSFFGHQHHALRMQINPVYPLYSLLKYAMREDDSPPPLRRPLAASLPAAALHAGKPTLLVFVMGETARADRFALNGYDRDTNPFTRQHPIINFPLVSACGTSTADSLPCIFSQLDHTSFSHAAFAENESLYQTLGRLGIDVAWRDNNTGCKDICDAASFTDLAGADDPGLCHDNVCSDEILLEQFATLIEDASRSHFLVLHQRGSHGPAYYLNTPAALKKWLPECNRASLQDCSKDEIGNAYDNTILYTDYFLARLIALLGAESDRYRTAMLYVSDHGESLGEKGLYLHGLPYALAPVEQTRVPMIFWAADSFYSAQSLDRDCLRRAASAATSHDAIFHTVLRIFAVESPAYDPRLDLFGRCRSDAGSRSGRPAAGD